jgi:hypothetical protein
LLSGGKRNLDPQQFRVFAVGVDPGLQSHLDEVNPGFSQGIKLKAFHA